MGLVLYQYTAPTARPHRAKVPFQDPRPAAELLVPSSRRVPAVVIAREAGRRAA